MIQDAVFNKANFSELENLTSFEFENCEFNGISFSVFSLKRSLFADCKINNCNLAGKELLSGTFRDVQFTGSKLMGLNWCNLNRLENCSFTDCKLDLCSFQGQKLKRTGFINCSLKEVDFSDADLTECDFSGSFLAGASFVRANLAKADLRSAKNYFIDPSFTKIKGARFKLPEALVLLQALGAVVEY